MSLEEASTPTSNEEAEADFLDTLITYARSDLAEEIVDKSHSSKCKNILNILIKGMKVKDNYSSYISYHLHQQKSLLLLPHTCLLCNNF